MMAKVTYTLTMNQAVAVRAACEHVRDELLEAMKRVQVAKLTAAERKLHERDREMVLLLADALREMG